MVRQHACHRIQQAGAVARRDVEHPALRLVVRHQADARVDRKAAHAARHAALARRRQRAGLFERLGKAGLDHAHQVAVVLRRKGGHDLEGVERVAVAGGVHLGVDDAERRLVEVAADAHEQVGLVGRVDDHLQAFADGREPGAHDGRRRRVDRHAAHRHVARQLLRMPGNLGSVVPHEVADIERFPECLVRLERLRIERQLHQRVVLARFDLGTGVRHVTAERAQRGAIQVFEQLALPGVPHARRGAADVGNGEQIKAGQVTLAADAPGKGADHLRIAQVLLLRDRAHGQVLGHQKLDQLRAFAVDVMLLAKTTHVARAERGMIAAAALGNVVEQGGHVEHPGLVPASRQLRAERIFVRVLGDEKAAHVAQHHEDVLVDRIDMKQVVLHLPDDAAEHAQVAAEHRRLVHQPHRMRDAAWLQQHAHERHVIHVVVAELAVHDAARVVERPQRARRQAVHADGLLVQQEGLEDRVRIALVQVVADDLDQPAFLEKPVVDAGRLIGLRLQPLGDVEQHDLVQLRHRLGCPVVAPHQRLAGLAL